MLDETSLVTVHQRMFYFNSSPPNLIKGCFIHFDTEKGHSRSFARAGAAFVLAYTYLMPLTTIKGAQILLH